MFNFVTPLRRDTDVTLCEVYEKIRNDEVLRQRTLNYRKAVEAKLPF